MNQERINLAAKIRDEMARARQGENLQISGGQWLELFHLEGDEPDSKTMMDRLTEGRHLLGKWRYVVKEVAPVFDQMTKVVRRLSVDQITPQEEELAQNFATVASRQMLREGDICPGASFLATMTYLARPRYFPKELHPVLNRKVVDLVIESVSEVVVVAINVEANSPRRR